MRAGQGTAGPGQFVLQKLEYVAVCGLVHPHLQGTKVIVLKEGVGGRNLDDHVEAEGDKPGHEDPNGGEAGVPEEALPVRVRLALGERDGG